MKFNIARQPLVPAFLTLVAITALAMWRIPIAGQIQPADLAIPTRGQLAIPTIEELLAQFQAYRPVWARLVGGMLMLFTGMSLGRLTLRYNLYSVGTCLAIPFYAALTTALVAGGSLLTPLLAAALLTFSVKNFARSYCNGYGFDALFRASFYLGLMLLVFPAALALIALVPLAIIRFHRTLREAAVALTGLLLPLLAFGYVNWGAGGELLDPCRLAVEAFTEGSALETASQLGIPKLAALGTTLLIDLAAIFIFLSDSYAAGNRSRAIFSFEIGVLVLLVPTLLNPVATPAAITLFAVPSAVIIPFLVVRVHHLAAFFIYTILVAGSVALLFLQ